MAILVREATEKDLRFVKKLAVEAILHGVPYGRETPNRVIQARVREQLRDLEPNEDLVILIAHEEESEKPVGYLILQLAELDTATGDLQSNVFDLAVLPSHWGTPAVRELVREAARCSARAGRAYMAGEVSAHNQRTYLQALRLGFELERFKIVMHCSEEGPIPMPSRPEEERAYQNSRGSKDSKNRRRIPSNWNQARESSPKKD